MANKQKPKLHKRKCKICGVKFQRLTPLHYLCSYDCAVANAKVLEEKNNRAIALKSRKELREAKQRIKTKSQWLKEAQSVFNKYIRLRDANLPCISCSRFHNGQYHAGHYRTVGSAPSLRFSEFNVHKQCSACNLHLSGNLVEYRKKLILKIGLETVEALEADQSPKHYTIEDIKSIKAKYSALCKQLEKENNHG